MHFIFDGGRFGDGAAIVLQVEELDDFRFTARDELEAHLPPSGLTRVTGALAGAGGRNDDLPAS